MANALTSAKESVDAGDEAVVVFDGAGTKWLPELVSEDHRYHRISGAPQRRPRPSEPLHVHRWSGSLPCLKPHPPARPEA